MADTQEIEQEEVDTTAEKAKAIGKEIGVVEDKPEEDVPDYDIVEEKEDTQKAEPEEDKRLAKNRADKPERKILTNKEKRDLRKKRIAEKFNEKDETIAAQQARIAALEARQSEVDNRLLGIDKAEIDNALNSNIAAFNAAEAEHAAAFTEGDGTKATKAMRAMYDAQKRIDQLQGIKAQVDRQPVQPQRQEVTAPDRAIVNKAKAWAQKHEWYKPEGADEDSEIAKAISGTLAKEGFDPKTDDFWDELDDRLSARGIGDAQEEIEDEEEKPEPRRRASPPVNGNARRSDLKGKKTVTLPTSYIKMLKENGIYDDKKRLAKVLADRERILRENSN